MKLGIDFGTTRIVAAASDRGNYPVINFDCPDGSVRDWFPPLVATLGSERLYGWQAWSAQEDPSATVVRSLKRVLSDAGPHSFVQIGEQIVLLSVLLREMFSALKTALLEASTLRSEGPLEIMLGVPANANSNQRFLTVEAFREAGFSVLGVLNEPSAASIEYGHSNPKKTTKDRILVYDFGGGTFDASLVELAGMSHAVVASEGIGTLGGDDFDHVLAEMAYPIDDLSQAELFRLHEECRIKKEALNPKSRKIVIDLESVRAGLGIATVSVGDFYDRAMPLIDETLHATRDLIAAEGDLECLYVTGGGAELPLVSRILKETFGRKVRRGAYTRSATAIGLAIQSDTQTGYDLREKFTRFFGVWRETDSGRSIAFDPLFAKGLELPHAGDPPVTQRREYTPVHNIGHFRYLECSHLNQWNQPAGEIAVWDEIQFAFDPALKGEPLGGVQVRQIEPGMRVREIYSCDSGGTVQVKIANLSAGYERTYKLGRWAAKETTIVPGHAKRGVKMKAAAAAS